MTFSIANPLTNLTPASLVTLEECSAESIYAPGYIQPHGILLTLQESDLTILQVSENVKECFGISAASLIGQSLQCLFPRSQVKHLADALRENNLERCNPFELKTRNRVGSSGALQSEKSDRSNASGSELNRDRAKPQRFRGTLLRTANDLILELEPQLFTARPSIQFYHRLQSAILMLRSATDVIGLAQTLAREIKAITGFDRVMVYRFESDDHGVVIAEEKESYLESYLGLNYPATDIPAPARALFLRNWVRQIPNVNAGSSRLIAAPTASNDPPLDLSGCILRGVSPYHVEYLQNMGVTASLTISLISDQRLWGLISCHHHSPRLVDYEIRKTCEFLGQFASIELVHQQDRALSHYQTQVQAIQNKLQQAFLREPNFIQQVLTHNATDLLKLVHAEGVAIALDQQISLIGQTPPLDAVQALLTGLLPLKQSEIYWTDCIAQSYPPAKAFKESASGLLAISIVLHQRSYHLIWFRPEQIQFVNWAGSPHDAITVDALGQLRLCPRKSFELWKETVQETSLPWEIAEVEAARMMRNTLMIAVLEFSQAALEQAAERAAIANRAKSQFLAKMSHELRTPLNAILGFTQVMNRNPNTPADFQEHLGIISRSGEHLLSLINDVLEMSRIEAGQLVLTERYFNLHRLMQSMHELFALKASQKGLTLVFEKASDVPRYSCGDEAKVRQILINLISNAIKFTTQGSVTVQVSTEPSRSAKQHGCTCPPDLSHACQATLLTFAVKDTGCGINVQNWESIFEAFMQTEQGRRAEGTGLGLSISRQFARLMGGDITVQSTAGQGSTFTCQIVVYQPEGTDLLEPETTPPVVSLAPGQRTYRILVAEDLPENRQLMKTLLEPIGFQVSAVENGAEAIAQWRAWQPHLILMDIRMPIVNGYEATQRIRAEEGGEREERKERGDKGEGGDREVDGIASSSSAPAHPYTPIPPHPTKIIALTAYAFDSDRLASLEAGCDDYLAKPFTETALFEMIARHLDVQYRYADNAPLISDLPEQDALTAQDFAIMPTAWLAQMHEAALDLDDSKIRELMTQIPQQEDWLIERMAHLVDNFQLDAIANLTQL